MSFVVLDENAPSHVENINLSTLFLRNVFSVALHPDKQILATASDDRTWKLWSLPDGELMLTGYGHADWVASCDFHPSYVLLARWLLLYLRTSIDVFHLLIINQSIIYLTQALGP